MSRHIINATNNRYGLIHANRKLHSLLPKGLSDKVITDLANSTMKSSMCTSIYNADSNESFKNA